jgi:hypothetical protein
LAYPAIESGIMFTIFFVVFKVYSVLSGVIASHNFYKASLILFAPQVTPLEIAFPISEITSDADSQPASTALTTFPPVAFQALEPYFFISLPSSPQEYYSINSY